MTVRRIVVLASLCLAGVVSLGTAPYVEADPHELYDKAADLLTKGRLHECAATLTRLHALITSRPDWDPEGTFARDLLPPLRARLGRLEASAKRLDEFSARALQNLRPPQENADPMTLKDYAQWTTSVIERVRTERDGIIRADLADPEERAILMRTESYARTERLLETDVVELLAETAGDDVLGLLTGDPRLESVLVRFRQLKRDLLQVSSERDEAATRARKSEERLQALLVTLDSLLADEASSLGVKGHAKAASAGDRFALLLEIEGGRLRSRTFLSEEEREALRARLARYRRYNQALLAAGSGRDQRRTIETLSQKVQELPPGSKRPALPPSVSWVSVLMMASLIAVSGLLAFFAAARGRRLGWIQGPRGQHPAAVPAPEIPPADGPHAERDAA
jgi:hypothetical protein